MQLTFVGATAGQEDIPTPLLPALPPGIIQGDILVYHGALYDSEIVSVGAALQPAGWTEVATLVRPGTQGSSWNYTTWYKIAGAAESTPVVPSNSTIAAYRPGKSPLTTTGLWYPPKAKGHTTAAQQSFPTLTWAGSGGAIFVVAVENQSGSVSPVVDFLNGVPTDALVNTNPSGGSSPTGAYPGFVAIWGNISAPVSPLAVGWEVTLVGGPSSDQWAQALILPPGGTGLSMLV